LLAGVLLTAGSACLTKTEVKEVPVLPEPCGVPVFPTVQVQFSACGDKACVDPAGLAALAAWGTAVVEWKEQVLRCPFLRPGADLRTALKGDPHLHP